MKILPNGVAVIEGDSHHALWCSTEGLIHDQWMAGIIKSLIKPGDLVIDGGANIGTLTAAMLEAGAQVLAFEPNPEAFECLVHNCPDAQSYQLGLADRDRGCGMLRLENAGASYLTEPGVVTPETKNGISEVRVTALDSFPVNPALIKLDVEGWEVSALNGAVKTILRAKPSMIIEVNKAALKRNAESPQSLLALIRWLGYDYRVLQPECDTRSEQYDVLCLPI